MGRIALAVALLAFSLAVSAFDSERHDALYAEGIKLIEPYVQYGEGAASSTDSDRARSEVNAGIEDLRRVVEMNPNNASAYWFMGMAYGALKDYENSTVALGKAYAIHPLQPDFGREYAHALMCSGSTAKAAQIARAVSAAHPTDPGLTANLALALLADDQLDDAESVAQSALKLDPEDLVTQRLVAEIGHVKEKGGKPSYRRYCR